MQKKYEESSNESFDFEEERYPWFILDDVNDLIFIINTKRLIVYVNKKVVDLGIPKKNLIGTDLSDLFYEKNIKNQINYFFHKKSSNKLWVFNYILYNNNHEEVPIEFKLETFTVDSENLYILIGKDLSENFKYEKEIEIIRKNEAKIRNAFEFSQIGIWEWDLFSGIFDYDERYQEILGYDEDPFDRNWEVFEKFIDKEDLDNIITSFKEYFEGKREKFEGQYRIKDKNNNYKWFLSRGKILEKNKFGLPKKMLGTYLDITEYKKQIDSIKKEKSFVEKVMENMGQGLVLLDFELNVQYANKSFYNMLHKKENIQNYKDFINKNSLDNFKHTIKKIIDGPEKLVTFESTLQSNSSNTIPVLIAAVPYIEEDIKRVILVITDMAEKKKLEETLKKFATFDELTGSYNRRVGFYSLEKYFQLAKRRKEPLSIVFIDIDNLKYINDNFGHDTGDYILKEVSRILRNTLRESDLIIRVGGDEFILGLPNAETNDVIRIFQRVQKKLENIKVDGNVKIEFSYGISEYKDFEKDVTIESLIKEADNKMYLMKRNKQ